MWRREIATADTAAVNAANQINAQAILGISQSAYENLWQYYADTMEWAWTSADNEAERPAKLAIAKINADSSANIQELKNDYQSSASVGSFMTDLFTTGVQTAWKFGF